MFPTTSAPSGTNTAPRAAAHLPVPLPLGLREEADSMTFDEFHATYASTSGPVRLGQWECTDGYRPSTRLGPQARNYRATIAIGDRISTATAAASGPIAALTSMLYDCGVAVELLKFHQLAADDGIATFVHGTNGSADEWAMGMSDDATQSALRAMIACANRLLAA
jgi:hypothetical protein